MCLRVLSIKSAKGPQRRVGGPVWDRAVTTRGSHDAARVRARHRGAAGSWRREGPVGGRLVFQSKRGGLLSETLFILLFCSHFSSVQGQRQWEIPARQAGQYPAASLGGCPALRAQTWARRVSSGARSPASQFRWSERLSTRKGARGPAELQAPKASDWGGCAAGWLLRTQAGRGAGMGDRRLRLAR